MPTGRAGEEGGGATSGLAFGPFRFDPETGELWREGEARHLRPQSQEVLSLLLRRSGRLVSRDELRAAVSGGAPFGSFDQGVNDCIREIRATLGDDAVSPTYVETLPRRGYRFRAPVFSAEGGDRRPSRPANESDEARRSGSSLRRWIVGAALAAGVLAGLLGQEPRRPRLLVVPLAEFGPALDDGFAAGLTEELIAQLETSMPLSTGAVARTPAPRGARRPASELGRELAVDYVVEGSVRRSEEGGVRVDVRLVEAASDTAVWTGAFERRLDEPRAVQSEIALAVSRDTRPALHEVGRRGWLRGFRSILDAIPMVRANGPA